MHPSNRSLSVSARIARSTSILLLSLLALLSATLTAQTLVPAGSAWRYLDNGSDPGDAWRSPGFDDSAWAWGPAQLGYGDGDEITTLRFGPDAANKYITTYFRKPFTVTDASVFDSMTLRILRDDGVVAYLNGVEIFRNNLPEGTITRTTLALLQISGAEESTAYLSATLAPTALTSGNNVLAVEIHQGNVASGDISFDLELQGISTTRPTVVRGPYLQRPTPSSMTLRWRTSAATDSRVRFGTNLVNLDQTASGGVATTEHSVRLTGLAPNSLYYYAVGDTTGDLAAGSEYFFYTPPPAQTVQPMRFWALGDAGTGASGQVAVRNAFYSYAGTRYTDLILLLGDNAYNTGTDAEYEDKMFAIYPSIFRSTPSVSTVGNHDVALQTGTDPATTPYFQIFDLFTAGEAGGVPSGTEKYYSFDYGNVHFVCLDSMTSTVSADGAMLTWLEQDLSQNTADWLIAFFHHPPYTKGSHNSDTESQLTAMRSVVLPVLEAHGVDLVLSGHSHSYERSFLLDGHYGLSTTLTPEMKLDAGDGRESGTGAYVKPITGPAARQGAVYVVSGSAGKISGGTLNHPAMFVSMSTLGSVIIEVNNQRLDALFLTDTGATNDSFTLQKGASANLPPSITLSSPPDGGSVAEASNITITASVLDSDGTVAAVEFFADGNSLGTDISPPFSVAWSRVLAGPHVLMAVATDDDGAQATSNPIHITAAPALPAAPSNLVATSPMYGAVVLKWNDNSINEASFNLQRSTDGVAWAGINSFSANITSNTNRYGLFVGTTYLYRLRALNAVGSSAYAYSAPVTVMGSIPAPTNKPPTIAVTAPSEGSSVPEASNIAIAVAVSDSDGTVTTVQFYADGQLVNTDTSAPFNAEWAGALAGTHVLTAVATDDDGAQTVSTPVNITATPSLPADPSNLIATSPSTATIALSWKDNSINEESFVLQRSEDGINWVGINTLVANTTSNNNRYGILSGRTYFYRIRARNSVGYSAFAYSSAVTAK